MDELEKKADLWCDGSDYSEMLQKRLRDKGYTLAVHLGGHHTPVLDYNGRFYQGGEVHNLTLID